MDRKGHENIEMDGTIVTTAKPYWQVLSGNQAVYQGSAK